MQARARDEDGYGHIQRTRPQTLAYGLHDSPAGLPPGSSRSFAPGATAAATSSARFTKDELLTNVTLYWVTETFGSSTRLYYDGARFAAPLRPEARVDAPTAIALTTEPVDRAPRAWAERTYRNLQQWTEFPRGGHFMAAEEPQLLAADIRTFFRRFR